MTITTRPAFRLATASLTALILGSGAAMADTWRYAFEEALETAPPPSASPSRHPRELSRADPSGEVLPLE